MKYAGWKRTNNKYGTCIPIPRIISSVGSVRNNELCYTSNNKKNSPCEIRSIILSLRIEAQFPSGDICRYDAPSLHVRGLMQKAWLTITTFLSAVGFKFRDIQKEMYPNSFSWYRQWTSCIGRENVDRADCYFGSVCLVLCPVFCVDVHGETVMSIIQELSLLRNVVWKRNCKQRRGSYPTMTQSFQSVGLWWS